MSTRIFGIGLQRTGTTTLDAALSRLGVRSIHFPMELYYDLESPTLTDYQAFSDNPLPLIYRQLDRRYPGSRFILTTRGVEGWLRSCEWLFTIGRIEFGWREMPVVDLMHQSLYGTTEFDETAFRRRWEAYHDEVRAYFRDRPGDLLEIDFTAGQGWEELCGFLDLSVPAEPLPRSNASSVGRTLRVYFAEVHERDVAVEEALAQAEQLYGPAGARRLAALYATTAGKARVDALGAEGCVWEALAPVGGRALEVT